MKKIILLVCFSLAIAYISSAQWNANGKLYLGEAITSNGASPGVVYGTVSDDNFLYQTHYLNNYGFGFRSFTDGTKSPGGINAYMSGHFGIDLFTGAQSRLRIDANGNVKIANQLVVSSGANINSVIDDADPGASWLSNLSVRNTSGQASPFSRITFETNTGGFGTITVKKTGEFAADMYFQVRSWAGHYQTPLFIKSDGKIGIGTLDPDTKLTVKGVIHTNEVRVDMNAPIQGPDYVFEKDYNLLPLSELETYINKNKHLPEVPSAKEMEADGLNLKEMNLILLKKVEELTLHLIEMKKENAIMNERIEKLEKE